MKIKSFNYGKGVPGRHEPALLILTPPHLDIQYHPGSLCKNSPETGTLMLLSILVS
jgi:hypothetical protein